MDAGYLRSRAREAVSFGPVLPDAAFRMTSIRCIVVPLSSIHEAITRIDCSRYSIAAATITS